MPDILPVTATLALTMPDILPVTATLALTIYPNVTELNKCELKNQVKNIAGISLNQRNMQQMKTHNAQQSCMIEPVKMLH